MDEFAAEHPDIPFSFLVTLFADTLGYVPDGEDALIYWEEIGDPRIPVLADFDQRVIPATPYDGSALPGKCALTPEMEILTCWMGHGNEDGLEAIVEHWEANR